MLNGNLISTILLRSFIWHNKLVSLQQTLVTLFIKFFNIDFFTSNKAVKYTNNMLHNTANRIHFVILKQCIKQQAQTQILSFNQI